MEGTIVMDPFTGPSINGTSLDVDLSWMWLQISLAEVVPWVRSWGNDSVRCLDIDNRQIDCSETEYSPALALDIGY